MLLDMSKNESETGGLYPCSIPEEIKAKSHGEHGPFGTTSPIKALPDDLRAN